MIHTLWAGSQGATLGCTPTYGRNLQSNPDLQALTGGILRGQFL
jgi:hypothetical protein